MAGSLQDVNSWRLHSNNGVVPLKFLGLSGSFESEKGSIDYKALIPSEYLLRFLTETFPPPITVGNLSIPQSSSLPGMPGLIAKSVSFESHDTNFPIDPFEFDSSAPAGTYFPAILVTVTYGMDKLQQPDPTDPTTFLEITCNGTGEFIHSTAPNGKWQHEAEDPDDPKQDDYEPTLDVFNRVIRPPKKARKPAAAKADPTAATLPDGTKDKSTEPVTDPTVTVNIRVPITEWTVKWKQVPYDYFHSTLIYRLRWCLGHVNSLPFVPLKYTEPETVLFYAYNYMETYTWREGQIGRPPIDVEMKFLEKRNVWNGVVCGHNHFWMPSKGWKYLLVNGKTTKAVKDEYDAARAAWIQGGKEGQPPTKETGGPTYQSRDLNVLFKV